MKLSRFLCLLAAMVAAALLLAACGGSSSSSSSSESTNSESSGGESAEGAGGESEASNEASSPAIEEAEATVAQYEGEQKPESLPKLGEVPAEGEEVVIVTCPIPACQQTTEGAVEGAKALGWKYKYVTSELTPENYVQHFSEIAAHPPAGLVWISAFPDETIKTQLAELESAGVAMAQISPQAGEEPTPGIPSIILGPPVYEKAGAITAAKIIVESEGAGDAVVVYDPAFGSTKSSKKGWEEELTKSCPECGAHSLEISLNSPASQNLSKVIAYLRQNPDVKYVYFTISDMAAGFPGALASAGLSDVQFITETPNPTDMKQIEAGTQWASVATENPTLGMRGIDAIARQLQGESVGPEKFPLGWFSLITKNNVTPEVPNPPGYPQNFFEAWGVEG